MAQLTDNFITFAYLKAETDIPQNVESDKFDHKISRAQEKLRMLMGDEFYQDFLITYKAGPLSGAYQSLYNPYIKQFVAWQAVAYWIVESNYAPTRSGYRIQSDENSIAVPTEEMGILITDRKQQAEYYSKLLVLFLDNHASDYPLYNNKCKKNSNNTFHISVVRNKHKSDCDCHRCGTRRW